MRNDMLGSEYDWDNLRKWCISFLRLFLEHAEVLDTRQGWKAYGHAMESLPQLTWKKIKRIPDDRIRFIVEAIASDINEASDKKAALPGMFNDAITASKELLPVLERNDDLDIVYEAVIQFSGAM